MRKIKYNRLLKRFAGINIFLMVFQLCFSGMAFTPAVNAQETQGLCSNAPVDIVLVIDRSQSMADGGVPSRCEWNVLQTVGTTTQTVTLVEENLTAEQCAAKPDISPPAIFRPSVENKFVFQKNAAISYLSMLGPSDKSAIVSFGTDVVINKELSSDHSASQAAINSLVTGGGTNVGAAINLSNSELSSARANPKAVKAMIILTDSKINQTTDSASTEDAADISNALQMANVAAAEGYKIFTIGLAPSASFTTLQNLALLTGGSYNFALNPSDLNSIYTLFGERMCAYGSISGCKYLDANGDGSIMGDVGLPGWQINLGGAKSLTQATDSTGCYAFAGLSTGNYTVSEAASTEYTQTYPVTNKTYNVSIDTVANTASKDAKNIDFANFRIATSTCGDNIVNSPSEQCDDGNTLSGDGCSSTCQNEGVATSTYSISGSKYKDADGSATTTGDRTGVSDWTIELFDVAASSTRQTVTDTAGKYVFNNLLAGDYQIKELMKVGWTQLIAPISNIKISTASSSNNDFVNFETAATTTLPSISGFKYKDTDGLSTTTNDRTGVADWTIELFDITASTTKQATTDTSGHYEFKNVSSGSYKLREIMKTGWTQLSAPADIISIGTSSSLNNNFVNFQTAATGTPVISGHKYKDADGLSTTTNDRTGVADWTIELFDKTASSTRQATTNVSGYYEFADLLPGDYQIRELLKLGWVQLIAPPSNISIASTSSMNNDFVNFQNPYCGDGIVNQIGEQCDDGNLIDGDGCSCNCLIDNITSCTSSISGFKYKDADGLASTTGDRVGLPDWTIQLFDVSASSTKQAVTNGNGYYEFTGLKCGNYRLNEVVKTGWAQLEAPADTINLTNASSTNNNFVNRELAPSISGFKYKDTDGAASTTNDRIGVADWTIELFDVTASTTKQATTSATGYYEFSNLLAGDYQIRELMRLGWAQLLAPTSNITIASTSSMNNNFVNIQHPYCGDGIVNQIGEQCDDGNTVNGDGCSCNCLIDGSSCMQTISGYKYRDSDGIATTTTDIVGVSDWIIELFDVSASSTKQAKTDGNGYYEFKNMACGDYQLREQSQAGWTQLIAPATNIKLATSSSLGNNFVNYHNAASSTLSISGYKYKDADGSATTTADRTGVAGWIMELFDVTASSTKQATTSVSGYYEFNNLASGDYRLKEIAKSGWTQLSAPNANITIASTSSMNNNFVNYQTATSTANCGNGIVETGESCDSGSNNGLAGYCNSTCTGTISSGSGGGGGGGGGGSTPFFLLTSNPVNATNTNATTTTNATSTPNSNGNGIEDDDDGTVVLGEEASSSLSVVKRHNQSIVNPGATLDYTITITNSGELDAFNVVVEDELPDGMTFVENGGTSFSWTIGTIPAGQNRVINYKVKVSDDAEAGVYRNIVTVTSDNNEDVSVSSDVEVRESSVLAETGIRYLELLLMFSFAMSAIVTARSMRLLIRQ